MNKVVPIFCIALSVMSLILSIIGLSFAILKTVTLLSAFAIVFIVCGFVSAALTCGLSFVLVKSKLCIAAGIISAASLAISITAFIVLI